MHTRLSQHGTTLFEILVTSVIVVVVATMAMPGFAHVLHKTEAASLVSHLSSSMMLARQAAVMRNTFVILCPASEAGCGTDWKQGLLVFSDHNNDRLINGEDKIMLRDETELNGGSLSLRAFGNRRYLVFLPDGTLQHYTAGNFLYCPANRDARYARSIVFNRLGRTRIMQDNNHDGVAEDAGGKPLSCAAATQG